MFDYTREKIRQIVWDTKHHLASFPEDSNTRLLVVQEEGLGNSVLTTPLIQALATLQPKLSIDVLVNRKKGADLVFNNWALVNAVWDKDALMMTGKPVYYHTVLECHPRHDLPQNIKYRHRRRIHITPRPGIDYHWLFEKHETEYLLDLARGLGYQGGRPAVRKLVGDDHYSFPFTSNMVAIGIGYYKGLRADGRDWSDRHWGNQNFLDLCEKLIALGLRPILVGDQKDFDRDGIRLAQYGIESICGKLSLSQVIDFIGRCCAYIGNDTGLMHVAAAHDILTLGIFVATNSVKSYPLGSQTFALGGDQGCKNYRISVEQVYETFSQKMESFQRCYP